MTIKVKIAIAILLAILFYLLTGCAEQPQVKTGVFDSANPPAPQTTIPYLEKDYRDYNEAYFQNRLPMNPRITLDESDEERMASTRCNVDGEDCTIRFNLKFVLAQRMASLTLLHEMCHVRAWKRELEVGENSHGRSWRTCMTQLDTQSAFRHVIIDNYWLDQ
jgi:hypothetical protein